MKKSELIEKSENAYKSISEVAAKLELEQHILRFWESKFSHINPHKKLGRRYYTNEDIKLLEEVKDFLYVKGYTIKGAQLYFANKNNSKVAAEKSDYTLLNDVLLKLKNIEKTLLSN